MMDIVQNCDSYNTYRVLICYLFFFLIYAATMTPSTFVEINFCHIIQSIETKWEVSSPVTV
jgi:hypothetical protein